MIKFLASLLIAGLLLTGVSSAFASAYLSNDYGYAWSVTYTHFLDVTNATFLPLPGDPYSNCLDAGGDEFSTYDEADSFVEIDLGQTWTITDVEFLAWQNGAPTNQWIVATAGEDHSFVYMAYANMVECNYTGFVSPPAARTGVRYLRLTASMNDTERGRLFSVNIIGEPDAPIPTQVPTATATPTATQTPTGTPSPTVTATPTPTPTGCYPVDPFDHAIPLNSGKCFHIQRTFRLGEAVEGVIVVSLAGTLSLFWVIAVVRRWA